MAKYKEQFDDDQNMKVSDKLGKDLNALFKPKLEIPHEIDRLILNKASLKLSRKRSHIHILRWIGPVAAAAAIILFVCLSNMQKQDAGFNTTQTLAAVNTDIDNNGKVNILDAFKLAKIIESKAILDKKWDINGDGLIDNGDVDQIALVAVSLK